MLRLKSIFTTKLLLPPFLKWLYMVTISVIGLSINILDSIMVVCATTFYFDRGDMYYGGMTLFLLLGPPMITVIIGIIWLCIQVDDGTGDVNEAGCFGYIMVCWAFLNSPYFPILMLVLDANDRIKDRYHKDRTWDVIIMAPIRKAITESWPQACLQMFVISRALLYGSDIGYWQWMILATSLISLAYNVSTTQCFFIDSGLVSQAVIFFHGIMAVTSRIAVACLFSMAGKALLFLPIGVELAASILKWMIKRWMSCSESVPLAKDPHYYAKKSSILMIAFTWFLTMAYNSFNLTGLLISSINLMFAVGGYFLPVPEILALLVLTLATISFIANVILTTVPNLRYIGTHWLDVNEDGGSFLY